MAPSAVEVEVPAVTKKSMSMTNGPLEHEALKSPDSPLPEVKVFDASTCTVDELVSALKVAGGVVIRGLLNEGELASLEKDTRPWLEKDKPWEDGKFEFFLVVARCVFFHNCRTEEGCLHTVEASSINISTLTRPILVGDFFPKETRRAFGMVSKSRVFAERIVGHPLWGGVTNELLSTTLHHNWVSLTHFPCFYSLFGL